MGDAGQQGIGIGMIGAGFIGRLHAVSMTGLVGGRLVAITSLHHEQSRQLAEQVGADHCESVEELLARDDVHAVAVLTPTDTHCELALQAIAAGKHVFVEKPIARTYADGAQMVQTASEAGVVLNVGHVIRYFEEYRALEHAVRGGALGTIAVATFGRRCQKPEWSLDGWHLQSARSGGVIFDMTIHDIDLVRWYFGEPTRAYARCLGPDDHNGLDYALSTLRVHGGPICHLHASWAEPEGFSQQAEICGSGGMVSYDSRQAPDVQVALHAAPSGAASALVLPATSDPVRDELQDFVDSIQTGEPTVNTGEWALASLRIALALLESNRLRAPIDLREWVVHEEPLAT